MLQSLLASLALAVGLTSAVPHTTHAHHTHHAHHAPHPAGIIPRQASTSPINLLVAGVGQIRGFSYNGTTFTSSANDNVTESGTTPSWMVFKEPKFLYAVDENSKATRLFNYDPTTGILSNEVANFNGSAGVVHLAFNADKTRLIGSSYGQGQVDVWDSSSPDGHLKLDKQIVLPGTPGSNPVSQPQPRAHQAVLDPSGRFFLISDIGGDALHIVDTQDDLYSVVNTVPVTPGGSGPRHGAFISVNGTLQASHYVVACEHANTLQLFSVSYDNNTLSLTSTHTTSTYDATHGPKNATTAAAGELIVSQSGPVHIYVSNRFTGEESDHIARFTLEAKSNNDTTGKLVRKGQLATNGIAPRMMTFSKDAKQGSLFVANMNGDTGLIAFKLADGNGMMTEVVGSKFPNAQFSSQTDKSGYGPQFILAF